MTQQIDIFCFITF